MKGRQFYTRFALPFMLIAVVLNTCTLNLPTDILYKQLKSTIVQPGKRYSAVFSDSTSARLHQLPADSIKYYLLRPMFRPVAIIKADQFVATSHKGWEKFLDFISSKYLRVGVGLIASTLLYAEEENIRWLKSLNQFQFEFYFNGWDYFVQEDQAEFEGKSLQEQVSRIQWSLQVMKEKLNITPHTFATPANRYDSLTTLAVQQFPEFKIWLLGEPNSGLFMLNIAVPVETPSGEVLSLEDFISGYLFWQQATAIVLEVHPHNWTSDDYDKFETIYHYLINNNRRFATPFGYFAWIQDKDAIEVYWSSQNAVIIDCTKCTYAHDLVFAVKPEKFIALDFGIPDF